MIKSHVVGVIGAGAMGSGIAQVAATAGHEVFVYDTNHKALEKASDKVNKILERLLAKDRLEESEQKAIINRIHWTDKWTDLAACQLIIEAIVEDLSLKKEVFSRLEALVDDHTILASNTSSLSIASISSACKIKGRVAGLHFFNPPPLMPLVEIIPALGTDQSTVNLLLELVKDWRKIPVLAMDTPGFIVNRIARPFYGEALRIYEEGWMDLPTGEQGFATIDWAMREVGGFRMGPFELMDYIGNDVNFAVTQSVYLAFFNDPRYRPSVTQQRLTEAGCLGRKTGRGYYTYMEGKPVIEPIRDSKRDRAIVNRILAMLINEAVDALRLKIASAEDIELAMTKGANYPKGLLAWGREWGYDKVYEKIMEFRNTYHEERYRPSPLLLAYDE